VIVTGVIPNNPADLKPGDRIISANGTNISTYHDLYQIAKQNTIISVTTAEGKTTTFPAGALVFVNEGGPLAKAGAPITAIVITSVEDTRIVTTNDLLQALQDTDPGEQITLTAYVNGSRTQYVVTLGNDPDDSSGFLGVTTGAVGISGVLINDLGVQFYPAGNYLSALGGTCERCPEFSLSFIERIFISLQFPLIGLAGGSAFPYNFAGFTGGVANFYTITGPLSVLGSLVFLFANILFWTGWININLAFFNCIPTFALDGGSMFRTAMEGIVARMPIGGGQQLAMTITIAVQIVMLASLFLLLFGAQLLN
ncbi:MAG: site-2 protease family protein, partial [Halobacteriaceae archaeon]